MLKTKTIISLSYVCILVLFAIHFYVKADKSSDLQLIIICSLLIILIPLVISSTGWLLNKSLFHPIFFGCSTIMLFLVLFLTSIYEPEVEKYERKDFVVTIRYFQKKAGFLTNYRSLLTFDESIDSNRNSTNHIIKTMYLIGNKDIYIGKVKIDSNYNVIKVFYNQKATDDTLFARKEFNQAVHESIEIYNIISQVNKQR